MEETPSPGKNGRQSLSPIKTDPSGRPMRDRFAYQAMLNRSRSPGPAVYHPRISPTGDRQLGESGMMATFHGSKKTMLQEIQARSLSPGPIYSPVQLRSDGSKSFDSPNFSFGSRTGLAARSRAPGPG